MLKAIDFFCGAGGLTRGLLDAGINVVAGIDMNNCCRLTYEKNNKPAKFFHSDIQEVNLKVIRKLIGNASSEKLVFTGCAPCQPFSQQRKGGYYSSERTLLAHFGRLVAEVRPAYVVIENVRGIAKVRGNSTYTRFIKTLDENGYHYCEGLLDAKCFGVPQSRKRWVVIASRIAPPALPSETHGPDLKTKYRTVRHAISHFPKMEAGENHPRTPNHRTAILTDINIKRLMATPKNGGSRRDWPKYLQLPCHSGEYTGHPDVYGRLNWEHPAPTLTCRCYSISNGRYGHPEQNRAISLREAAALQSFPDDYVFYGNSQKDVGMQIGNAVPVLMAKALGKTIIDHYMSVTNKAAFIV
jgi:DNA (cytosine-5)-methyltransferase 1